VVSGSYESMKAHGPKSMVKESLALRPYQVPRASDRR
jgi:hypothetical protein